MQMKIVSLVFCLVFASIYACSGKKGSTDAKEQLTEYISRSFSVTSISDRKNLEALLTGDAKNRLAAWTDDQFKEAFIDSKRKFGKLTFRENKPLNENEVNITYELTYEDFDRENEAKITNRKMATLIRREGVWLIREVVNIRELVEFNQEMSLP